MQSQLHIELSLIDMGSTASRYEFQGRKRIEVIKWRLYPYEYTIRYDLYRRNRKFMLHYRSFVLCRQQAGMGFRI